MINLNQNHLTGEIALTELPPSLCVLSANRNGFTGSVDFSSLPPNLYRLCLRDNALSGVLDLRKLGRRLSALDVRHNMFEGKVLWSKNVTNLCKKFKFGGNKLCGFDPADIDECLIVGKQG